MSEVLVADNDGEQVYYRLEPDEQGFDGRLVVDGTSSPIKFWSYVSKVPVTRLDTSVFHQHLWNSPLDAEWYERYFLRTAPLAPDDVDALRGLGVRVPSSRIPTLEDALLGATEEPDEEPDD